MKMKSKGYAHIYILKYTYSKNNVTVVSKNIWSEYLEIAGNIRHSPIGKKLYPKRSETIERVFAYEKEKHGFRYTNYRSKAKMKMEALLTFIETIYSI